MFKTLAALLFCLPLFAGEGVFPYPIQQERLANGLNVVTVTLNTPGLVTFNTLVRVGSRDEVEPGKTGFAHFFEHVMFRGTEKYPQAKYDEVRQQLAASGNANTWMDRTYYYMTGNAQKLETFFEIEADRFQHLKYSEHGFKTEAGAVLGEYTKNFSSPFRRYLEKLTEVGFTKHTYGHTTMGYIADIKDMPNQYAYSLSFYDRFYRPEYCTLLVVGDVKHEQVMEYAKKYYSSWEKGSYKPEIPEEPAQTESRTGHIQFEGTTNFVGVHYQGPAFSDSKPDKLAISLLMEMYFGPNSDIYKELVREKQKVSDFSDVTWDTRDPYPFGIIATLFKVEDTDMVRTRILETFRKMRDEPLDEALLNKLKSRRKYSMAATLDTPEDISTQLATMICLTGDPESLNRLFAMMDKITTKELKAAAQKYINDKGRLLLTLSAEEKAR